jgi:hypothetical protein
MTNVELRDGEWHSGARHGQQQTCIEVVDLDVNPDSPYRPRRVLEQRSMPKESKP